MQRPGDRRTAGKERKAVGGRARAPNSSVGRAPMSLAEFVRSLGQPYSEMLGIKLETRRDEEVVKWFLAALLYSKPIRESSATLTYRTFAAHKVLTGKSVLRTGWDGLVRILDEGGYTRYDFSTADKLLAVFRNLEKLYGGSLNALHAAAKDSRDLEARLRALGKGIGATTVSIFLRDMRRVWAKADPTPSPLVQRAMDELGIVDLKKFAVERGVDLVALETALLRYAKDYLKKGQKLPIRL